MYVTTLPNYSSVLISHHSNEYENYLNNNGSSNTYLASTICPTLTGQENGSLFASSLPSSSFSSSFSVMFTFISSFTPLYLFCLLFFAPLADVPATLFLASSTNQSYKTPIGQSSTSLKYSNNQY